MKYLAFILSCFLFFSCQQEVRNKGALKTTQKDLSAVNFLDLKLDSLYKIGVFNGFSAAVVDSSGILYNKGFGYADVSENKKYSSNTLINMASVSKVFIGVAVLKAVEMNLLNLDDPINNYLPFKVVNPNYPDDQITIRQLATHTSSIVDTAIYMETCYINKDDIAIEDPLKERYALYYQNGSEKWMPLVEYLNEILERDASLYDASSFAQRKPGALREYSNVGAALCALVVESVVKKPFHEFTKENIFIPLGMSSTSWLYDEVVASNYSTLYYEAHELPYYTILSYPDGGLISSSSDMSLFLMDLIKGYSGSGTVLSTEGYNELFRSQLEKKTLGGKENFNVGLFIDKELAYDVIGHTGGDPGTNTMMYFNTATGKGRIFISNTDSDKENSSAVFWGVWNVLDTI